MNQHYKKTYCNHRTVAKSFHGLLKERQHFSIKYIFSEIINRKIVNTTTVSMIAAASTSIKKWFTSSHFFGTLAKFQRISRNFPANKEFKPGSLATILFSPFEDSNMLWKANRCKIFLNHHFYLTDRNSTNFQFSCNFSVTPKSPFWMATSSIPGKKQKRASEKQPFCLFP